MLYKEAKKSVRHSKHVKLKRAQAKLNKLFKDFLMKLEEGETVVNDFDEEIYSVLDDQYDQLMGFERKLLAILRDESNYLSNKID